MAYAFDPQALDDRPAMGSPEGFARYGFIAPVEVLESERLSAISTHIRSRRPTPADWHKGRAVTDRVIYEIATDPKLMTLIADCLGADVILWGADIVARKPGRIHPWHTDIESADPSGGFLAVWIGLENTKRESSLQLIAGSHLCSKSLQEIASAKGRLRGEVGEEDVVAWAREVVPEAELVHPDICNGQAIIFDGRLWHSSENRNRKGTRRALLLQYAQPDRRVRMPEPGHFTHPFRSIEVPRPPAILVRGTGSQVENRLVLPPPSQSSKLPVLSTVARQLAMPLAEDAEAGWKPYQLFRGITRSLERIDCHASVLSPGHCPHPPHAHIEEEILIMLDGTAELIIADSPNPDNARIEQLSAGSLAYYPAFQHHTIRNSGSTPISYLMVKWVAAAGGAGQALDAIVVTPPAAHYGPPKAFASTKLVHGPTRHLARLHAHRTVLQTRAGYEAHADPYDVFILVLSGEIETVGATLARGGFVFCAAGESHGMENPGDEPATYLVLEFHAPGTVRKMKSDQLAIRVVS